MATMSAVSVPTEMPISSTSAPSGLPVHTPSSPPASDPTVTGTIEITLDKVTKTKNNSEATSPLNGTPPGLPPAKTALGKSLSATTEAMAAEAALALAAASDAISAAATSSTHQVPSDMDTDVNLARERQPTGSLLGSARIHDESTRGALDALAALASGAGFLSSSTTTSSHNVAMVTPHQTSDDDSEVMPPPPPRSSTAGPNSVSQSMSPASSSAIPKIALSSSASVPSMSPNIFSNTHTATSSSTLSATYSFPSSSSPINTRSNNIPSPSRLGRLRSASNPEGMEKWDSYNRRNDRQHFVLPFSILEEELASTRRVLGEDVDQEESQGGEGNQPSNMGHSSEPSVGNYGFGQASSTSYLWNGSAPQHGFRGQSTYHDYSMAEEAKSLQQLSRCIGGQGDGHTEVINIKMNNSTDRNRSRSNNISRGSIPKKTTDLHSPPSIVLGTSPDSVATNSISTSSGSLSKLKDVQPSSPPAHSSVTTSSTTKITRKPPTHSHNTRHQSRAKNDIVPSPDIVSGSESPDVGQDVDDMEGVDESMLEPEELLRRARSRLLEDLSEGAGLNGEKGCLTLPHSLNKYKEVYNKNGRIGIYTPAERAAIITKFNAKRARRVWNKKIRYNCRKNLADRRMRVKGRFVKRSVEAAVPTSACSQEEQHEELEDISSPGGAPVNSGGAVGFAGKRGGRVRSSRPNTPPTSGSTLHTVDENEVQDLHEDEDEEMPDVEDEEADFAPTDDMPYRRTRRHTIT